MKTVTEITEIENQTFKDSIFNLNNLLPLKMPEYFEKQKFAITLHEDYAEVMWHMKKQLMAEDLTEILEKQMDANIMFAFEEDNGAVIKIEAYSRPVEDSMYIIYASSEQHGIIDAITVFFYDSFDTMYHQLRNDYHRIINVKEGIIERQSLQTLISNFI